MKTSLLAILLTAAPAARAAALLADAVHAPLPQESGWQPVAEERGVSIFTKTLHGVAPDGADAAAFMGVKTIDPAVDTELLFYIVSDIANHGKVSTNLAECRILYDADPWLRYYQVVKTPGWVPVAPRYYFNRSQMEMNLGGVEGHHRRRWSAMSAGEHPDARQDVASRYDGAVEIVFNHGSWEVRPEGDGHLLIYRATSDPGGNIPEGVYKMVTRRTLAQNMLEFEAAAKQASGG